jgi:glycolate oxidase
MDSTDSLLVELRAKLGQDAVLTDTDVTASYRRDMMPLAPHGNPLAVVFPVDTAGVQATVRACAATGVPIVPRGAGSGLSGAANAIEGCVVLAMTKMNEIVEIDADNRLAVVEPGVVNLDFRNAVEKHGLFYPPDPSSYDWCTIGGNLSTNAGGLCCVKYGVTTDSVLGLDVVLADGELLHTGRRTVKGVAGYDLTKLFVGSEGTLGVITEVTLRLVPPQQPLSTVVANFASVEAAAEAVLAVTARLRPAMLEFMDSIAINAVEDKLRMGLDRGAAALLLGASDERGNGGIEDAEFMAGVFTEYGATEVFSTSDPDEGEAFVAARRFAIPAVEAKGPLLLEDVGVPLPALADLVGGIARIAAERDLTISVIAHAGDGNTHPLIVYDPADPAMSERAELAYGEIMDLAMHLGGTITGEHGVGRLKRPWLAGYLGPDAMALNRRIKDALDPLGILNPGAGV